MVAVGCLAASVDSQGRAIGDNALTGTHDGGEVELKVCPTASR